MYSPYRSYWWWLDADGLGGLGCLFAVFGLALSVAFFSALSSALGRVSRSNRRMDPGQVWLNVLPFFNLVWLPVTVERVGESLRAEFVARGRGGKGDGYGKATGLTALCLYSPLVYFPPVAVVTVPFALIYTLVYWVQIARLAGRLKADDREDRYRPPPDEGW